MPAPYRRSAGRDPVILAGVDHVVDDVLDAIGRRDWAGVKPLLHPYLHWTEPAVRLRGRTKVLAHLASIGVPPRPDAVELRDGQIYRWIVSTA
ncbi:hypothetical protein Val02_08770 [Virgisporangium aliadipatigenens]|uniref:Uncharacterized protein n=1 Tax=Virgisporangium aliadipatigenens TaxID=741659 RepID=A0A8J4DNN3_9ACTN|nr:nuclear transport factor 2 family protein [Virgisporangium aliadipatigenens]GIJ43991.1 hypothetical protein Val02_08770 [Virgisporangium aliadipatigenens]